MYNTQKFSLDLTDYSNNFRNTIENIINENEKLIVNVADSNNFIKAHLQDIDLEFRVQSRKHQNGGIFYIIWSDVADGYKDQLDNIKH